MIANKKCISSTLFEVWNLNKLNWIPTDESLGWETKMLWEDENEMKIAKLSQDPGRIFIALEKQEEM